MRAAHAPAHSHWFHAAPLFTRLLTSFEKRKLRVRDRAAAVPTHSALVLELRQFLQLLARRLGQHDLAAGVVDLQVFIGNRHAAGTDTEKTADLEHPGHDFCCDR